MNFKSGFVTIVGRPNVGKSTLINNILGHKVSIVSNKAQTTRNNIRGILNKKDEYQIIFIDTPGVHNHKRELDRFMNASALRTLKDVDLALLLIPADETIGKNDLLLLREAGKVEIPTILVITKSDLVKKDELFKKVLEIEEYKDNFDEVIITSSIENINLEKLIELIIKYLPENDYQFYDDDVITDQPDMFFVKEIIRENILLKTGQEVPHSIAILVDEMEEKDESISIIATIVVERQSQKGIIIGKQASKIKDIKYMSRKKLESTFGKKIELELFVKVVENWRTSPSLIKRMGYNKSKY